MYIFCHRRRKRPSSPLRTTLLVSEIGRRQRKADFAFNGAVSMKFIGAPSMAWDSMRLQAGAALGTIGGDIVRVKIELLECLVFILLTRSYQRNVRFGLYNPIHPSFCGGGGANPGSNGETAFRSGNICTRILSRSFFDMKSGLNYAR